MAKPSISGNPGNILVTAAKLQWGGADLGLVSGVKITTKHLTTSVNTDQAGKSIVNDFHVGDELSVELMMDEYTAQKMAVAYPRAAYVESGGVARVAWGRAIGDDFYSIAQELVILPTADDVAYSGRRFTLYKAAPIGDSTFEMGPDKKIQIKVMFKVYPDFTKPDGEFFGYFGDAAAGALVPASSLAPVAGVGNVGNGTVSGVIVSDDFTLTEVWTLTCIAAQANAGLFSVVGSVTGARGPATVGVAYASNSVTPGDSEIQFLISDGTTDFAIGDSFTISVTAASKI